MTHATSDIRKQRRGGGATGPRTAEGKRRSSQNARRYAFTHVRDGGPRPERVTQLYEAFLVDLGGADAAQPIALEAAEAQFHLEQVQEHRLQLIRRRELDPETYIIERSSDKIWLMRTLAALWTGGGVDDEKACAVNPVWLMDYSSRIRRRAPSEPDARHALLYERILPELERLERYVGSARIRRRDAFRAISLHVADRA